MPVQLDPKVIDTLLLGPGQRRRQLQDLPVLGDVWSRFAEAPGSPQDLLIIPTWEKPAAAVASIVVTAGEAHNGTDGLKGRSVAFLNGLVVATLNLEDVIDHVFPGTRWWDRIEDHWKEEGQEPPAREVTARWIAQQIRELFDKAAGRHLQRDLLQGCETPPDGPCEQAARLGFLLGVFRAAAAATSTDDQGADSERIGLDPKELVPAGNEWLAKTVLLLGANQIVRLGSEAIECIVGRYHDPEEPFTGKDWNGVIFQVTLNRSAEAALAESVAAIKGDAARSLFSISCSKLAWAVLDSGIDHQHPAFRNQKEVRRRLDAAAKKDAPRGDEEPKLEWYPHRIKGAFDFTRIRAILGVKSEEVEKLASEIRTRCSVSADDVRDLLQRIIKDRGDCLPVDWRKIQPLIEIDTGDPKKNVDKGKQTQPSSPLSNPHGTHVAGIIGADWWKWNRLTKTMEVKLQGVCPDIWLYDCRVLGSSLGDSEFAVSAALQFIRFYNEQGGHPRINGVNMSLSIRHNVRNYACGRTPVCIEAEALVSSGVIVVAAAGNRGFQQYQLADSSTFEGYAASSITDPGNAEGVITVGSTHRAWPHTYGVSFFSSRGPTGDGRLKPDLLAPGEKIVSCIPGGKSDEMDGTSMAAPHVSGAAALLMARHEELKGRSARVKEILCSTATDLRRERSFQGHGMVDVLRAIQSV